MLGRNGNTAYVRYDHQGRIVPGGPIIQARPPKVGNWQAVSNVIGTNTTSNTLRAFIRIDYFNRVVPSSLVLLTKEPGDNDSHTTWVEINAQYRGNGNTTTTTTSTSSSTTSTTTTAIPYAYSYNILWVPPGETFFGAGGCAIPITVVYSNSFPLTSGTRLYRYSNLTDELESGGQVWKQIAPLGQPNNFNGATYVEGSGILAFNAFATCDATTTTTTSTSSTSTTTSTTTVATAPLILTFNIANDGDSLTLPFNGSPSNTVYWGDGSSSLSDTHTYATAGDYDVTIYGTSPGFNFFTYGDATSKAQVRDVKQWGTFLQPGDWSLLFNQCGNLTGVSATDNPQFGSETNLSFMFGSCTSLGTTTTNMSGWNTSGITNMSSMFNSATSFNSNIGSWDTSSVTDMSTMFESCYAFNQNIGSWNVSSLINMSLMFHIATSFNQNLNSWNVSNVTDMTGVFAQANSFNGNISSWNVSSVTSMNSMFNVAPSFNQDISNWDVSNVTNMNFMLRLCTTFNQDLSGWCVSQFPSEPFLFSQNTFSWSLPKPIWGTCPP